MPLTLSIRNAAQLDNGSPLALVLDKRGGIIGRAPTTDWCLPDPQLHISSRHAEVRYFDGRYELIDLSTNGTFLHGDAARLPGPHTIGQGDVIVIGRFEIVASLDDAAAAAAAERNAAPQMPQWQGWAAAGGIDPASQPEPSDGWGDGLAGHGEPAADGWGPAAAAAPPSAWGSQPAPPPPAAPAPAAQGWGAQPVQPLEGSAAGWGSPPPPPASAPPAAAPSPPPGQAWSAPASPPANPSTWAAAQAPVAPASDWSSPVGASSPAGAPDVWGKFAASNVVDWARGGFGSAPPRPAPPPAAPRAELAAHAMPPPTLAAAPMPGTAPPGPTAAPPLPAAPAFDAIGALAAAAGCDRAMLGQDQQAALTAAGDLLRRLVAGLVIMLEARARAKSQMGAQGTSLEFEGNNPLKFARSPELALVQLLNPPERGFMPGERAVEDAFKDLQAHQMATLIAMQGALRATLERFSPDAIRKRAETGGLMKKIMPGARDAALWAAYEKEFSGVAQGSDEAFMDMFAKEFRRAYEEVSHQR